MSLRQFVPPPYRAPFSHKPGIEGWLAGSQYSVKIFPTKLELYFYEGKEKKSSAVLSFPKLTFSDDWTVFFDSIRQKTIVQGHSRSGFFRYEILVDEAGIALQTQKGPLYIEDRNSTYTLEKKEKIFLVKGGTHAAMFSPPRLLLGINKDPNLDRIHLKPDLLELLPYWYQLTGSYISKKLSPSLFSSLALVIEKKKAPLIAECCMRFFRAGISGYFVPKSYDDLYHGFQEPLLPSEIALEEVHGAIHALLRSLFLRQEGSRLSLLTTLPKEWRNGRLLREKLSSSSLISIEWRKSLLRRVLIHAQADEELFLDLPGTSFFLSKLGEKGSQKVALPSSIKIERGSRYLLDHFSN